MKTLSLSSLSLFCVPTFMDFIRNQYFRPIMTYNAHLKLFQGSLLFGIKKSLKFEVRKMDKNPGLFAIALYYKFFLTSVFNKRNPFEIFSTVFQISGIIPCFFSLIYEYEHDKIDRIFFF